MSRITIRSIMRRKNESLTDLAMLGLSAQAGGYVLAVDFDGTLCEDAYPNIGNRIVDVIRAVKRAKQNGIKVILWTCREGESLQAALDWCGIQGLTFDAVNDNTPERKALYGNNPRKVGYDELWDDRAMTCYSGQHS